ncbi:MAG: butyrate kinase [Synergistales bacterium]|nr:butyrate kinase [Synergistales bacterium]
MSRTVLAINPGSTSTKIALFDGERELWRESLSHEADELAAFGSVAGQYGMRLQTVKDVLREKETALGDLDAVVGRGGIVDPIPGGTYRVTPTLLEHLRRGKPWEHASNLGGIIADALAGEAEALAYIVDPVAVDEMDDVARFTGLPELPKRSLVHALNVKATVRMAARDLGRSWDELSVIVAHLGGGFSICAHRWGRIVDVNNANEFGPFAPERAGGVPAGDLARLCYSGHHEAGDLRRRLVGNGGLRGYLGTSDMRTVRERVEAGDEEAERIYDAMAYQVAKEIGACAASLAGEAEAILMTGGVAHDNDFVELVQRQVQWIAPVLRYPGEDEMLALAEGALRVLDGEEPPKRYEAYVTKG